MAQMLKSVKIYIKMTELIITLTWYYQSLTWRISLILIFRDESHCDALTYEKSTFYMKKRVFCQKSSFFIKKTSFFHKKMLFLKNKLYSRNSALHFLHLL